MLLIVHVRKKLIDTGFPGMHCHEASKERLVAMRSYTCRLWGLAWYSASTRAAGEMHMPKPPKDALNKSDFVMALCLAHLELEFIQSFPK